MAMLRLMSGLFDLNYTRIYSLDVVCAACVIYVEQMATISQANNTLAADALMPFQCIAAVRHIKLCALCIRMQWQWQWHQRHSSVFT